MKGFFNIGNTCFMNAGLQMIMNNDDITNIIINTKSNNNFIIILQKFIQLYKDKNINKPLNPKFIKDEISKMNKNFVGFRQNDSDEFLHYFLNYINTIIGNNIIDKLFTIKLNNIVKCKVMKCLYKRSNYENSVKLELDVDENINNLDDLYKNMKKSILLEDGNMVYCDKCKKNRISSKKVIIEQWPNNLIIHIKRFKIMGTRYIKYCNDIDIPYEWRHNYKLKGFIYHSGSLSGGHYVYFGNYNNKWYLFNDTNVKEINIDNVNNLKNKSYIFYYKKNIS
jgi:ubiquitin carboxyl-terminal hydrolase 2